MPSKRARLALSLGGGDDVIGGDGVIGVRQGNFHDFRAEFLQLFHGGLHGGVHFRIQPADHVFLRQAEFQALDIAVERGGVIRHRLRHAGGIARVNARS